MKTAEAIKKEIQKRLKKTENWSGKILRNCV